jgi:hypothetical protein
MDEELVPLIRDERKAWRCGVCGGITRVDDKPTAPCATGHNDWIGYTIAFVRRDHGTTKD